jgi:hypothetical protein
MGNNDTSDKLNSTTKQVAQTRDEKGRITGGMPPVGFHTNPENRSDGGWKKENSIGYQYRRFLNMTTEELKAWDKTTPENERTVAMDIAYAQIIQSRKSLPHAKEVTDRTEGKAPQAVDITSGNQPIKAVQVVDLGALNADKHEAEPDSTSDKE